MNNADFMQIFADVVQTLNKHYADYNARVHLAHFSVVDFLKVSWGLQDLRGVKETGQCWLLPGALTGREAGRPRVVWLIRSNAISGGEHNSLIA